MPAPSNINESTTSPAPIRTILAAIDDTQPAGWGLDEAVRLAVQLNARLSLLHVVDVAPIMAPEFVFNEEIREQSLVAEAWDLLHGLADQIPEGFRGQLLVREGHADKEIILAAQELDADLLVLGTHGRNLIGRFLLGSIAEAVVRHASCPVVTVAHPIKGAPRPPMSTEANPAQSSAHAEEANAG
ncbi:MAG TPA: universal stress protein [Tepidisphaeraceae bacterium]